MYILQPPLCFFNALLFSIQPLNVFLQSQFSPSMFLYSVSPLRRFVSAGRAWPPHGTVRIWVEKAPAQQIVYLRFNLQLRWSGHAAALYHRGDWRREWIVYTSFIINKRVSDIKYLEFIWMLHLWCDWVVLFWKVHCLCCDSSIKKNYKVSSITTCAVLKQQDCGFKHIKCDQTQQHMLSDTT